MQVKGSAVQHIVKRSVNFMVMRGKMNQVEALRESKQKQVFYQQEGGRSKKQNRKGYRFLLAWRRNLRIDIVLKMFYMFGFKLVLF